MMKLILLVLFYTFFPVKSKTTVKKRIKLIKEGDPFTLECDKPSAKWEINNQIVVSCEDCPSSKCKINEYYKERITAFCSERNSIIHFNSTRIDDNLNPIRCLKNDSLNFYLRVGKYDADFHSENNSTFALHQKNFTLVCIKRAYGYIDWLNEQGEILSTFTPNCVNSYSKYDTKRFYITCDKKNEITKLHIKNVTLEDDGNIFGCSSRWRPLYLFRLRVNVPVTSVSIQPQSQPLVENEEGTFICKVEESKPETFFQWMIAYQNGSSQEIQQKSTNITRKPKGKLWQTNSTLKLILKRGYHKIMCKATIENLPWANSEYQSLDIKYPPEITIHHDVTKLHQMANISCEAHANPNKTHYKMVLKWGTTERNYIQTNHLNLKNVSFEDLGHWVCLASNDVPKKGYYSEKSVEIKLNVSAQFKGETTVVGFKKHLKTCFYCYPEATDVKWYKGKEEMSSDRISYVPAEDGLFPFIGNCSILDVDITERNVQIYYFHVTNPVGRSTFELSLDTRIPIDSTVPDEKSPTDLTSVIVHSVISILVIIIVIGGIVYNKCQRPSEKNRNNIPANDLGSSEGHKMTNEPEYANIYDVPRRSGHCDILNGVPGSSGEDHGNQHQYIEIRNNPPVCGNHFKYGNEPFFMNVANTPIRMEQKHELQPEYLEILDSAPVNGQMDEFQPKYFEILKSASVKKQKHELQPEYLEILDSAPVNGQKNVLQPEYLEILDSAPVKEQKHELQPEYLEILDSAPVNGQKDVLQPEYLEILDSAPVKGFLDCEDLGD